MNSTSEKYTSNREESDSYLDLPATQASVNNPLLPEERFIWGFKSLMSYRFVESTNPPKTHVQIFSDERLLQQLEFLNCHLIAMCRIEYRPRLNFEDGIFLHIMRSDAKEYCLFIPDKHWKKREMLHYFQSVGVQCPLLESAKFKSEILGDFFAQYEPTMQIITIDPRPGLENGGFPYRFAETAYALPNLARKATLPYCPVPALIPANALCTQLPFSDHVRSLLTCLIIYGLFFSAVAKQTRMPQEKMILIVCPDRKSVLWFHHFFTLFGDAGNILRVSDDCKKMTNSLECAKDCVLTVDLDGIGSKYTKNKNLDMLRQYIFTGLTPSGYPASALTIFLGTGIPHELCHDDTLVVDLTAEDTFCSSSLDDFDLRSIQYFVRHIIMMINWTNLLQHVHAEFYKIDNFWDKLSAVSSIASFIINSFSGQNTALCPNLLDFLKDAEHISSDGCLPLFWEAASRNIKKSKIKIKKATKIHSKNELNDTIALGSNCLIFSETLLQKLLNEAFSTPPTTCSFRKMLLSENALAKSNATNRTNLLRFRIEGGELCYGTAISIDAIKLYKRNAESFSLESLM